LGYNETTKVAAFLVGVSETSDPTGSWYRYSIDGMIQGTYPDYPGVGYDENAVYITANYWNTLSSVYSQQFFEGAGVFVIAKSLLYYNKTINAWYDFQLKDANGNKSFTVKPAQSFGNVSSEYLLSTAKGSGDYISLWRIDNGGTTSPNLTLQATVNIGSYKDPPPAQQLGSSNQIQTDYCNTQDVVYINGYVYTSFSTTYNWGSGNVSAVRYENRCSEQCGGNRRGLWG